MRNRIFGIMLAGILSISMLGLVACNADEGVNVPYDDMIGTNGEYDENLFYQNKCDIYAPDCMVLKITEGEEAGYYYLYATNSLTVYRSKDLNHWENMTRKKGNAFMLAENDFGDGNEYAWWAPEAIYDAEEKMYYLYFSMNPRIGGEITETLVCVKSENPYGPFVNVRPAPNEFLQNPDPDASIQDKLTYGDENYFFDMATLAPILREKYPERFDGDYKYVAALDPHPFVDPDTGTKYLYWVSERTFTSEATICPFVMEMEDWETPRYDTVTQCLKVGYTTVDGEELCDCEADGNWINEGPFVYPREQSDGSYKYYLTYSANSGSGTDGCNAKGYSVLQAIGDSPMGPFTKLQKSQGGILLGTDDLLWDHVSGPGHHSFIQDKGELYAVYHQHMDVSSGSTQRAVAVDEVKFAKNLDGQEVMYANGPTRNSLQLLPFGKYKNIAPQATIQASGGMDATMLNDELISLYSYIGYVKEYKTDKKVTFTLKFDDYREITGIMIYNSKNYDTSFEKISSVKIHFKDGEKTHTGVLKDIPFDIERYSSASMEYALAPGGAAIAVFTPALIDTIEITITVPNRRVVGQDDDGYYLYQKAVALSEIKVIGI